MNKQVPILIESHLLHSQLGNSDLLIVNLCDSDDFKNQRIPGSIHIHSAEVYGGKKPTPGLVPSNERLQKLTSRLGLRNNLQVVAYDDEGGGHASRLVWTLYLLTHRCASVLNGGIQAWLQDGLPTVENDSIAETPKYINIDVDRTVVATQNYIKARLGAPDLALLDARTWEEYQGSRVLARRGGHIPGAVNLNWVDSMDPDNSLRLKPKRELKSILSERRITPDREVIVYCQTHHRSAHSWMMLRHLGYPRVRGYAGSWSEWGNDPETPIE